MKKWLTGKDTDAEKDWRQEEKGMTKEEMVGWHHQLYGHEFEQALGVGDGQGSLVCRSPWGHKESDMTEWLNWTDFILKKKNIFIPGQLKIQKDKVISMKLYGLERKLLFTFMSLFKGIKGMENKLNHFCMSHDAWELSRRCIHIGFEIHSLLVWMEIHLCDHLVQRSWFRNGTT